MVQKIGCGCAVVCALLANTSLAIAKEQPFGTPGQIAITNGFSLGADQRLSDQDSNTLSSIFIRPAAQVFVLPGFSMGGYVGYTRTSLTAHRFEMTGNPFSAGPSLGTLGI